MGQAYYPTDETKAELRDPNTTDENLARHHYTVAIVDDNPLDARLLRIMLNKTYSYIWDIHVFDDVDSLLNSDDCSPDVIFLDRYLPKLGLSESQIPAIGAIHDHAAIIVYTDHLTASLRAGAAHFGAFATIEKGEYDPEELQKITVAAASLGSLGSPRHQH